MNRQNEMTAELIAQLVLAGIKPPKIAHALGLRHIQLASIMDTAEYEAVEQRITNHSIQKMQDIADARLERGLALKEEVEDAVGEAIQLLLKKLRKDEDLKAALEILDRDPRHQFAKASRQDPRENAPSISAEAFSNAIKEAGITHKMIEQSRKVQ